jgi:hypothetical protein
LYSIRGCQGQIFGDWFEKSIEYML